jgi:hypothetical protein
MFNNMFIWRPVLSQLYFPNEKRYFGFQKRCFIFHCSYWLEPNLLMWTSWFLILHISALMTGNGGVGGGGQHVPLKYQDPVTKQNNVTIQELTIWSVIILPFHFYHYITIAVTTPLVTWNFTNVTIFIFIFNTITCIRTTSSKTDDDK